MHGGRPVGLSSQSSGVIPRYSRAVGCTGSVAAPFRSHPRSLVCRHAAPSLLSSRTGQRGLPGLCIIWGGGCAALGEEKMNFPLMAKFELVTPR